ncbi:predicted protein [Phaeodactylum tricornutum CCAP 1055/1]|jgi:hypothetical protein|uniref:Uncharacterized protein n=2 Tax=Phaeodactylum tricornutum TaxID=2850 RepID=B7FW99_PHATC|nr:predicted protein [Phaeodactylum tricornutum CCAP 1055/1]EEC49167.1 predicted protein [Phaeodactylum tricornutum CCAP 1055/1]|eukprot:XP_002179344.1 predicted protein [Phaeodactylum tricornutum CCAP 1055/1]
MEQEFDIADKLGDMSRTDDTITESGDIIACTEDATVKLPKTPAPLPVVCVLDSDLGLFRIIRCRGKTVPNGGFGVAYTKMTSCKANKDVLRTGSNPISKAIANDQIDLAQSSNTSATSDYLFIEEVLFLFERGLLEAYELENQDLDRSVKPLDPFALYQMLEPLGVTLPTYLVYAHLRAQTFRTVRHSSVRRSILDAMQDALPPNQTAVERKRALQSEAMKDLRQQLREESLRAQSYRIPIASQGHGVAFDVYRPESDYTRSRPGLPDYCVGIAYYNQPGLGFFQIQALLKECRGVPLKIATVSDGGTVSMFGVTVEGVPPISVQTAAKEDDINSIHHLK